VSGLHDDYTKRAPLLPPREEVMLHLVADEQMQRLLKRAAAWKAAAKRWRDIADIQRANRDRALDEASEYERRAEMRLETISALYTGRQLDEEQRRLDCDSCFMRRREEASE
jgi:hypothetical protein